MEELLQPGFFGERPQVDFFDAGAYRELPYLPHTALARLTGRTVEVHIVEDGTGLTNTAKGGLREFASEHGAIWHIEEEAGAVPLEHGDLPWSTAGRYCESRKGSAVCCRAARGDGCAATGVTYVPHPEPEASWPADFKKALVNSLQRESIPDAYAELFAGLQGEEESFEDYARRPFAYRARIMNECHCFRCHNREDMSMSMEDYRKAYKAGKREYQAGFAPGTKPKLLRCLDDILPNESLPQENLGLVQIPLSQIVGTRYEGRSSAFAANFMPLLEERTEFSVKWANLCKAHETERHP